MSLVSVAKTGAQSVTGATITLNGPSYQSTTNGGWNIGYIGAVTLGGPVAITTNNSSISFSSTVGGAHSLTLNAGAARPVTVTGIVGTNSGSGNRPTGLTVNTSAALAFGSSVWINGDVTLRSASVTLGGSFNAEGSGNVYLYGQNGAQALDIGTGATYLTTASLSNLNTAKTITIGESGVQSGLVSFATATLAASFTRIRLV